MVSRKLEHEAMDARQRCSDTVFTSKVHTCRQLQMVQRGAVQRLAELRVQVQRRGLMSESSPTLCPREQMRAVKELASATQAVIDSSDAASAAMEAALPDVTSRTQDLYQWSRSLVEGTRSLVTLGRDVRGVAVLGEAWRKARACQARPSNSTPRGPVFNKECRTDGPVRRNAWSEAAQKSAVDARAEGCVAQARSAAEAFERQPPGEREWQMFHDDDDAGGHNWQTPLQRAAAAAARAGVAKLHAQRAAESEKSLSNAAPSAVPCAMPRAVARAPSAPPAPPAQLDGLQQMLAEKAAERERNKQKRTRIDDDVDQLMD